MNNNKQLGIRIAVVVVLAAVFWTLAAFIATDTQTACPGPVTLIPPITIERQDPTVYQGAP